MKTFALIYFSGQYRAKVKLSTLPGIPLPRSYDPLEIPTRYLKLSVVCLCLMLQRK